MVVKVEKSTNYTVMSNIHLKDRSLSMKAKGLLSIVLSLPDNWEYSIAGLAALSSEKESAVKTALNELKEHGYLVVTKRMPNDTKSGRIEYEYTFFENAKNAKQGTEKQEVEILPIEILPIESQGQLNTNIPNTKVLNTNSMDIPPISPRENLFELFWQAYPQCFRKSNKKGCKAKFIKIKNLETIFPDIIDSLEMQKRSKQWNEKDGEYIPAPLTWINQERWTVTDTRTQRQQIIQEITKKNSDDFLI